MPSLKKVLPLVILVGVTVGALVGCPPTPTGYTLTVTNYAVATLEEVNIRVEDTDATQWGQNQLDAAVSGFGGTSVIDGIPGGFYDLRAVFSTPPCGSGTGQVAIVRLSVPITDSNWEWVFNTLSTTPGSTQCVLVDSLTAAL
jgi:hypothetical protein